MKQRSREELEKELKELKKDYAEAREEINDLKKNLKVFSESRLYLEEVIEKTLRFFFKSLISSLASE